MTEGDRAFAELAAMIRKEINEAKRNMSKFEYPAISVDGAYHIGKVAGMIKILALVDPEPYK